MSRVMYFAPGVDRVLLMWAFTVGISTVGVDVSPT
jgi:hypothetical protein